MPDKKKTEKLSIDEYKKLRELRSKRRFKLDFYPWPVMTALMVPLLTFIFLIIAYILHLNDVAK